MVLIAIYSYNRYPHLRLCLPFLLKNLDREKYDVVVWDDGSTDSRVLTYLSTLPVKVISTTDKVTRDATVRSRASRCGIQRQKSIDYFLENKQYTHVLMLDDDILIPASTVDDAIRDFVFFEGTDYAKIGALSLHPIVRADKEILVDGRAFGFYHFTGEANIIFSRRCILEVGNHFGGGEKEFADVQLRVIRDATYRYMSRVWPPYSVQHLGFGTKGSVIHEYKVNPPFWTKQPYTYRTKWGTGTVQVEGFSMVKYVEATKKVGGLNAPLAYLGEYNG